MRKAFGIGYFKNKEENNCYLMTLWRHKEAFSDGVSNKQKDTKGVIYEKIKSQLKNDNVFIEFVQNENANDEEIVKNFIEWIIL